MKRFYVYMLRCSDGTYYTGITSDLQKRYGEHQHAKDPQSYTAKRLPVQLVYVEEFSGPMTAIKREKQLKKWSRKKKEALIEEHFDMLPILAKKRFKPRGKI